MLDSQGEFCISTTEAADFQENVNSTQGYFVLFCFLMKPVYSLKKVALKSSFILVMLPLLFQYIPPPSVSVLFFI